MNNRNTAYICVVAMLCAASAAYALAPRMMLADKLKRPQLETQIPDEFGDWQLDKSGISGVVNPQAQAALDKIYSDIISRTYVNRDGYRIMLSVAYGRDQRDTMQLHYPEVCYPAQGFAVTANRIDEIKTSFGGIEARRVSTALGSKRVEPVTYWTTVGNRAVLGGIDKKAAEMTYGFSGYVPDGLLFRVSSIDPEFKRAYQMQDSFVRDLLTASTATARLRLAGLGNDADVMTK